MLSQILFLLTPQERRQAYLCFLAMLIMAIVEVIGVASIMPFIAVISNPAAITEHAKLAFLYKQLNFTNEHDFLIFLGFTIFSILIIGNAISMLTTRTILKFTYAREYSLSMRLLSQYLSQPYQFFLERNVSDLVKNILSEVTTVINRAYIPGMQLVAKAIISVLILLLLIYVDPILALIIAVILGGTYSCIFLMVRKKLSLISKKCLEDKRQKYKITTEALNGIKDIKLLGRENYFLNNFSTFAKQHAQNEADGNIIAHLPRYVLETIAFGGVLVIILYLLYMERNITNAMPILALYAFASIRLMPALQQIFTSVAFLRMSKDAINTLVNDLKTSPIAGLSVPKEKSNQQLIFSKCLQLKNIEFSYLESKKPILKSLNITIPANSTIGFVGMTGAGKTTIIDLILGLLTPSKGQIFVDDQPLTSKNVGQWQNKIGYVPQNIYLIDDTILKNIAFGVPDEKIDIAAVEKAAKLANIHDFISTEVKNGYYGLVGDRGVKLSGGQRQRIGIARALYHDPEILVLDEATSALDNITEDNVLEAIRTLSRKKTILIIAHRLTTLAECDRIYVLESGRIVSADTYQSLLKTCDQFKHVSTLNA